VHEDAAGVADFKRAVDEGFDDALAEVTAAIEAVPVAMTLPGLEPPPSPLGHEPAVEAPQSAEPDPDPLQERLRLDDDEDGDDAINSFAPDASIDWGPRGLKLTRHDEP
jgi:hypothetical protein